MSAFYVDMERVAWALVCASAAWGACRVTCADEPPPQPANTPSESPSDGTEQRFASYLAALEVYDRGIPPLHWRQSVQAKPDDGPPMDVWRGEMAVLEGGRWMARGDRFDAPDDTGKQVGLSGRWYFDGERLFTFNPRASTGLVRDEQRGDILASLESPLMLVGRMIDFESAGSQQSRLVDLLGRTVEREVKDEDDRMVVLAGSLKLGGKWFRMVVWLDRSRGFMPVRIMRIDETFGVLKEELRVTDAVEVAGTWIPTAGWRELHIITFANEDVPAKLRDASAAEAARGLDMDKRADRQEAQKFIRKVAGDHPFKRNIAAGGRHVLSVRDLVQVTDAEIDARLAAAPFEEGAVVLDVATGRSFKFTGGRLIDFPEDPHAVSPRNSQGR